MMPPNYITSPSGVFAFGFRALDASNSGKFLLATWFRSHDDDGDGQSQTSTSSQLQSVVWFAKQSSSVALATEKSVLSVTADGQLALTDSGNKVLWKAPMPNLKGGSLLVLLDSGSLRFLGDGVLWESFWYPTDTMLPGQSLTMDTRSEGKLISRRADTEFNTGRFSMGVQTDGNVVLYVDLLSGNSPDNAYWQAYTDSSDGNTTVTFDDQGDLKYTLHSGVVQSLISPMAADTASKSYKFARMDPDGIVRVYVRSKNGGGNTTSWSVSGAFPSDGCNKRTSGLQGLCGPGSYCTEQKDRLRCLCPDGYTYADPQHTDSGCTPEFVPQSCDGENSTGEYTLVELPNTTWETSIYYKKFSSVTEDQCRNYCLNDCYCAAALMIGGTDCAEVAALTNGRQASDVPTKALIKVRPRPSNRPAVRASARTRIIVAVTVCVAFVLLAIAGGFVAKHYLAKNRESQGLLSVRAFSWKELHKATNGFEKLLGKGSFGEVYQGKIKSSQQPRLIAVKRLINSNEYSEREFTNEVLSIGQIHHRNLVRMIGYCKEGKHRMLVLEFMPGGSLRSILFKPERPPWSWRAEAALGIARGIEYLHDGCASPIIHCDIKPDNILLDDMRAPKITDFGISKLLGNQQVHTTVTNIRGTRGYIAPEWFRSEARIDTKADVYSFGVVLLEMICCRRSQDPLFDQGGGETVTLFGCAGQLVSNQRTELILPTDDDAGADFTGGKTGFG
ncbi:hypothetical protein QYE76_008757 [Lolium multiflorum]|uniref:Receptor-like serine/threonine-protein kinase n=1 Tax=Lolium multiflorum TaxID=4521 RepID=A0AAD8X178_LOLMU|nr:hypothetical protein QYE76_008757 [Lolium multiflorum]